MIRVFSQNDYEFFKKICRMTQDELREYVSRFLMHHYDKVVSTTKYVWAQGTIPITLVAHLDTVFEDLPERIFYDKEASVIWSPDGLGADDRAGIYGILEIISAGYHPNVIFTTDEEKLCKGAIELVNDYKECPFPTNYFIELDKAGTGVATYYQCDTHKFKEYVGKFGFYEVSGSYSDISILMKDWGICGVNLGIGYESEHSKKEMLNVSNFYDTIFKVVKMLNVKKVPKFTYFEKGYLNGGEGIYF